MELSPHPTSARKCRLRLDSVVEVECLNSLYIKRRLKGGDMFMWRAGQLEEKDLPKTFTVSQKVVQSLHDTVQAESTQLYLRSGGWEDLPIGSAKVLEAVKSYLSPEK